MSVKTYGDNLECWEQMLPVLEEFSVTWDHDLVVRNDHGERQELLSLKENEIGIVFWPQGERHSTTSTAPIFGYYPTEGQLDKCLLCPGEQIHSPEGELVATVQGKHIYIMCDLPHVYEREAIKSTISVLRSILTLATPFLNNAPIPISRS